MNVQFINPPAHAGEREIWELWGAGPASYNAATGDLILGPGVGEYMSAPMGGFLTVSGKFELKPFPSVVNNLRPTWAFRWFNSGAGNAQGVDGVVIATAGTGQTNGTYTATANTGGAVLQYTIAGGLLTAVQVLNPGGPYSANPTFTIAAGGTPGTVTATIGSVAGSEVAAGINLSAELVQFAAIGGQL